MTSETQTSVSTTRKVCSLVLRNSKPNFLAPRLTYPNSKFFLLETNIFFHYLFFFLNCGKNIRIEDDWQVVIIKHTPLTGIQINKVVSILIRQKYTSYQIPYPYSNYVFTGGRSNFSNYKNAFTAAFIKVFIVLCGFWEHKAVRSNRENSHCTSSKAV